MKICFIKILLFFIRLRFQADRVLLFGFKRQKYYAPEDWTQYSYLITESKKYKLKSLKSHMQFLPISLYSQILDHIAKYKFLHVVDSEKDFDPIKYLSRELDLRSYKIRGIFCKSGMKGTLSIGFTQKKPNLRNAKTLELIIRILNKIL